MILREYNFRIKEEKLKNKAKVIKFWKEFD